MKGMMMMIRMMIDHEASAGRASDVNAETSYFRI